ncbi:site-specific integrase [Oxalobacteraceae bacterium OM1]|nr:site-specific integrase [Oxalobacteraceae bacterium OM1]
MPKVLLDQRFVESATSPEGKGKIDYFDVACKGLQLEVRASGGRTWYLRYVNERGKVWQFRLADARDMTLAAARKRADTLRGKLAMGEDPAETKIMLRQIPTFEAFVETRYMPFVKGYKRSWKTDECLLRNHLLPRFGRCHLDEITRHDIIAMLHQRHQQEGASAASANRLVIMMRYIFNLAIRWAMPGIKENPASGVRLYEENNKRERYLTQQELKALCTQLRSSDNPMLQYIIQMLILTGARRQEVLQARWEQFNLHAMSWRIPLSKSGKARHVPLSSGALDLLQRVPRLPHSPYVFPNPQTHKPYVSIFYSWDTARRQAGMPDLRIHDLRHSFASFLINAGRSIYEVQKILGHAQINTTQRYAHLSSATLLDAVNEVVRIAGLGLSPDVPAQ